jgi:hypothetical protein
MPDPAAPAPAGLDWSAIGNSIANDAIAVVKAKATGFLEKHPDALAHMKECAFDAAKALVLYGLTSDPDARADFKKQVELDNQASREEALSIIKDAADEAPSVFWTVLEDIGKIALGLAPILLKAI